MKTLLFLLLSTAVYAQDTLQKDFYIRLTPMQLYNTAGHLYDRVSYNIESGISLNMLDVGLCYGKTYLRKDTTNYIEARFTMDAAQYGIFSNEFGMGMGCIINAKANTIFEASYTIQAQLADRIGLGISVCYYDFTGRYYNISQVGYGVFFRYGAGRTEAGTLTSARTKSRKKL